MGKLTMNGHFQWYVRFNSQRVGGMEVLMIDAYSRDEAVIKYDKSKFHYPLAIKHGNGESPKHL